jgi:hypothetical protein
LTAGGAAILGALDAGKTPLRLPLSNDAADAVSASPDNARAELLTWQHPARDTEFDH